LGAAEVVLNMVTGLAMVLGRPGKGCDAGSYGVATAVSPDF